MVDRLAKDALRSQFCEDTTSISEQDWMRRLLIGITLLFIHILKMYIRQQRYCNKNGDNVDDISSSYIIKRLEHLI